MLTLHVVCIMVPTLPSVSGVAAAQLLLLLLLMLVQQAMVEVAATPPLEPRQTAGQPHRANSESEFVNRLFHNYNKQTPPMKDRPTKVQLGIYVNSFYSISEQTMDYSVSMYLRQVWRDPRLSFPQINPKTKQVRLGEESLKQVWTPDTFFRNEKRASFHEVTVNNRLMRLNVTGHIWYVTKISATLSCPMRLQKFPMDTQICPMMFESFGYTMDTLYFAWMDTPVDIDSNVQLPQFVLQGYILNDCSQNYTAGAFPCLEIRFVLRRDFGFFVIHVYVPSTLIVILSWVSFWINVDASPARVSIGLLTVLTTTTQSTGINAALPRVSYVKAVDVWMSVCLVLVFAGLIEYATVNVLSRQRAAGPVRQQPSQQQQQQQQHHLPSSATRQPPVSVGDGPPPFKQIGSAGGGQQTTMTTAAVERTRRPCQLQAGVKLNIEARLGQLGVVAGLTRKSAPSSDGEQEVADNRPAATSMPIRLNIRRGVGGDAPSNPDGKYRARRVDRAARVAFPVVFLVFNVVYWSVYTAPDRTLYDVNELVDL